MNHQLKLIFNNYLNFVVSFFYDMIYTFLRFVLHPLQFLFFKFPKIYEAIITMYIFIRNSLPTKNETIYTLLHWQYYIHIILLLILTYISRVSQNISSYILSNAKLCQEKQKSYLLRY